VKKFERGLILFRFYLRIYRWRRKKIAGRVWKKITQKGRQL